MYSIGDVVMYGAFGICKVTAIEKRDFTGEEQEYYILRHINSDKNIFYVPTNNDAAVFFLTLDVVVYPYKFLGVHVGDQLIDLSL